LDDIHFEASYTKKGRKRVRSFAIKTQGSDYADATEYSDGTLAVAAILAALFSKKRDGPILFVEELENCLHPAALERLVRFLQDHAHKWPVLITTHSSYLLNCVNPVDVNVAIVEETGAAHFEKVRDTKQLRDYLKSGFMSFGDMLPSNFEDVLGK
jgi:predicted ATPase